MSENLDKIESITFAQALSESLAVGAIQIASVIPVVGPVISAAGSASFLAYQNYNLDRAVRILQENINRLDQAKLDTEYLQSDEFKDLLFQFSETVARTSSEERCSFLIKVFCGCFTLPTSTYPNKLAIMRLAGQMTDEGIQAFYIIEKEEQAFSKQSSQGETTYSNVRVKVISNALGWSYRDTLIICQELQRLNIIYDGVLTAGGISATVEGSSGNHGFQVTELGRRLIEVALDSVFDSV